MPDLLNASVNQTLSRSVITHVTVSLALLALLLFGGQAIHSFTATMMFGVVLVGTYTSVFIASPILIYLGVGTGRDSLTASDQRRRAYMTMAGGLSRRAPHLPRPAPIDAYGEGGFRFAGMSHRGSLLCLPDGIWAWPVTASDELTEAALGAGVRPGGRRSTSFCSAPAGDPGPLPEALRQRFRAPAFRVDAMPTGAAVRTYNILLAENRRVGAGLIAVE